MLFHAASLVLGIPSTLAFLFCAWEWFRFRMTPAPRRTGASGDQLIDLFVSGFRLFAKGLALFAGAAQWMLSALAAAAFICALLAVLLFLTGRGINNGGSWARVLGMAIALVSVVSSLAAMTAFDRLLLQVLAAVILGGSVYVIWTLGWRFR